ncbi:hypothetical protein BXQ17_07930 [Polaribacter sp. BM10]|uniref:hypothetical protein n=1 Tax=Polaribacter sp. BM10 TaxID=1529069 RepID=UPI00098B5A98|nr:hypothetical protein [Polaribacter sp. BM10]AQS93994.1 hypothetical protein BXQ17_07930 [Polaribacter sp. BM10]
MKKLTLILIAFLSLNIYGQNISLNNLIEFKNQSFGKIEDFLVLKNWELNKKINSKGKYEGLLSQKSFYFKSKENQKSSIFINKIFDENMVYLTTERKSLYLKVLQEIKDYGYKITDEDVFATLNKNKKLKEFREKRKKYKVGDKITVENESISKKYYNGYTSIKMSIIRYKVVESINSEKKPVKLSEKVKTEYRIEL